MQIHINSYWLFSSAGHNPYTSHFGPDWFASMGHNEGKEADEVVMHRLLRVNGKILYGKL